MTSYTYSKFSGSWTTLTHTYNYSATNNDGKLVSRTDSLGEQVTYQYDAIHRLISATATQSGSASWSQQYIYDGFGNMKQKTATGLAAGTAFNIAMNSGTNNSSACGFCDMDERILGNLGQNAYAPDNKRIVRKFTDGNGNWHAHISLWVGSMRVATYDDHYYQDAQGNTQHVFQVVKEDWYLAGRRAEPSDRLGSNLAGGVKLMPFGEELSSPVVPNDRTKFATYFRDGDGLDYADQRYYSPGSGRFMTADPYLASGAISSPNSWNRYAYAGGDPVNRNDPTGRFYCNPDPPYNCVDDESGSVNVLDWYRELSMLQDTWGATFPPGPSYDPSAPLINSGAFEGWDYIDAAGATGYRLFPTAGSANVIVGVCIAQPELCVVAVGITISVYVISEHLPALLDAIRRGSTSRDNAPVSFSSYSRPLDENGNCPPPDPSKMVKWRGSDDSHWHWIEWNVRKTDKDCTYFPVFRTGQDPGGSHQEVSR